jgi:hypothetical protein
MNIHSLTAVQYIEYARNHGLNERAKIAVDLMSEQSAPLFRELRTKFSNALVWLVEREAHKDDSSARNVHIAVALLQGAYNMIEVHAKTSGTRIPQVLAEQFDFIVMRYDALT